MTIRSWLTVLTIGHKRMKSTEDVLVGILAIQRQRRSCK